MGIIALIATAISAEFILVIGVLLGHIPATVDPSFLLSIVWHHRSGFQPQTQRNLLFYLIWVILAIGLYVSLRLLVSKFFKSKHNRDLKPFLMFHLLIVGLMGHAGFAIAAVGNPVWAWPVFWMAFMAGIVASIFWPEFISGISTLKNFYLALGIKPWVKNVLVCLFIFLTIFIPDLKAFVAMMYMGDYFHVWDYSLFSGVYAAATGLMPGIDFNVPYGFGATVILAKIVNMLGGFGYERLFGIAVWTGIMYFILWFFLLKRFLSSGLLSFAAIVCALRMHMFSIMNEPCVWIGIMHSFFRFFLDIAVFWMIWMHIQTRRVIYLAAGAFFVSLALFYMLQSGIYVFLVFGFYVCVCAFVPCLGGKKDCMFWRNQALILLSIAAFSILWFYLSVGQSFFTRSFIEHLVGVGNFYLKGGLTNPLIKTITVNNAMYGIGGLLYPVLCMASFLYVAERVIAGTAQKRDVFAGLLGLYGLIVHTYYIVMVMDWYMFGMPGLFLLFYWITKLLEKAPDIWRGRFAWGLLIVSLYCLLTAHPFTGYPNLLNLSRNPIVDSRTYYRVGPNQVPYFHQLMADLPEVSKLPVNSLGQKDEQLRFEDDFADHAALKSYYDKETAWPEDAGLIRRLTPEGARVPILSSFETLLLQRAHRKPFFYYFPLINSRPLTGRNFMVTVGVFSYAQLLSILDGLEAQKPLYIFMERIFLAPQVPQTYFYAYDDLTNVLRYVFLHYEPVEIGKYLVAMKRVK